MGLKGAPGSTMEEDTGMGFSGDISRRTNSAIFMATNGTPKGAEQQGSDIDKR